jgi:hypothetical protein
MTASILLHRIDTDQLAERKNMAKTQGVRDQLIFQEDNRTTVSSHRRSYLYTTMSQRVHYSGEKAGRRRQAATRA